MNNNQGFALLQALFFMMFIMAVVAVTMMMSSQRNLSASGQRTAADAYVVTNILLTAIINQETPGQTGPTYSGTQYFASAPLYTAYITQLEKEGFSDPTQACSGATCSQEGDNLVITVD